MRVELREIAAFAGIYAAGSDGRIWRLCDKIINGIIRPLVRPRPLKGQRHKGNGYMVVTLYDGKGRSFLAYVHHLIATAFHGPRPEGLLALHRHDNKLDNRPGEIYYGTRVDNASDAKASPVSRGKLSETTALSVLLAKGKQPAADVARRHGIAIVTVRQVWSRKTWKKLVIEEFAA